MQTERIATLLGKDTQTTRQAREDLEHGGTALVDRKHLDQDSRSS